MTKLSEKTGILLDTQDGTLDLANVTWQKVASCGCVAGVALAAVGDELIVTPEQAGRQFTESAAEYKRSLERGFTFRPREHEKAVGELRHDCPHTPRFGYERPLTPKGMVWVGPQWTPRAQHLHLQQAHLVQGGKCKPLCGGTARFWSDHWSVTEGLVECKRCVAAAKDWEATA